MTAASGARTVLASYKKCFKPPYYLRKQLLKQ